MGKPKKRREKNIVNQFVYMVFVAIIAIIVLLILSMIYINCYSNASDSSVKIESSLLATGLSIIGIAITVWAGLNIINVLERKDVDECKSKMNDIEKKFTDLKEFSKRIENDIKENEANVDSLKEIYYNSFLQELLKTSKDVMSRLFYLDFSEKREMVWFYVKLIPIEQYFEQVFTQYGETSKVKENVLRKAEEGINLITGLESSKEYKEMTSKDENIIRYLKLRKSMFHFLKGYMLSGVWKYKEFKLAVDGFEGISKEFGIRLPVYGNDVTTQQVKEGLEDKSLEIATYFFNIIGESYSKLAEDSSLYAKEKEIFAIYGVRITKEKLIDYSQKAIFYLKLCTELSKNVREREVYYRNLGCAYERADKLLNEFGCHSEQIIRCYKEAFKKIISDDEEQNKRIQKVYHTLLSYYESYIKHGLYDVSMSFFTDKEDVLAFTNKARKIEGIKREDVCNYITEYQKVSQIAITDHARFSLQRVLNGMAWTWIVLLILNKDEKVTHDYPNGPEYYMSRIADIIETLNVMRLDDDYFYELKKRYEALRRYLNKQKTE